MSLIFIQEKKKKIVSSIKFGDSNFPGLYMTMSYGEEFASMEVDFAGKMTFGLLGENKPVLALRNCDIQCSCNMKTTIFSVRESVLDFYAFACVWIRIPIVFYVYLQILYFIIYIYS